MYNSYEEYMQSVLGMNMPNTYVPANNYYEPRVPEVNLQEINKFYPEIYHIVYPMVQKVCSKRSPLNINQSQIDEMVQEVYDAIEAREIKDTNMQATETNVQNKNGDVRNPRAKETRRPANNYLLKDLIKILIIRELLQGNWQNNRPPMQPMPPMGGGPGRPPIMRPGYMGMY